MAGWWALCAFTKVPKERRVVDAHLCGCVRRPVLCCGQVAKLKSVQNCNLVIETASNALGLHLVNIGGLDIYQVGEGEAWDKGEAQRVGVCMFSGGAHRRSIASLSWCSVYT